MIFGEKILFVFRIQGPGLKWPYGLRLYLFIPTWPLRTSIIYEIFLVELVCPIFF